jgi:copper(I)-binding protein
MTRVLSALCLIWCVSLSGYACAGQISVTNAWTRAGAPGQKVAAIYFDILSAVDAKLVAVDTDAAQVAEFHVMTVKNGTMRMRSVPAVDLPEGVTVSLKPGGVHVMLFDLNNPLRAGERIPVRLLVEDVNGRKTKLKIEVDVRNLDGSKVQDRRN